MESKQLVFDRKIFTVGTLFKDLGFLIGHAPKMVRMMRSDAISHQFMEKIMTVVTAVNGCSFCTWFHAKQAVASGISEAELQNMFNLQFQADASEDELTALLYAQHYAETNRHPDPEMTEKLVSDYGEEKAEQVMLVIRMIFFGNLAGNTFDAFLSRFKGYKVPNSSLIFEFFFFIFSAPFLAPVISKTKAYR